MDEDLAVKADDVRFKRVNEEHGWLGNMSAHKLEFEGEIYRSAEHLFQALRFADEAIKAQLRGIASPLALKMRVRKLGAELMVVEPRGVQDVANMEFCLKLKLKQHPDLKEALLKLGQRLIVEDIGERGGESAFFWGARAIDGRWEGQNVLGRLWMTLRGECHADGAQIAAV